MNPLPVLVTPWLAVPRGKRWYCAIFMACGAGVATLLATLRIDPTHVTTMATLAAAIGTLWVYLVPSMLGLTLVARRIMLPGVRRDATFATLAYALLSIPVPALLLALAGLPLWTVMVLLALVAFGGMLYALAPWYVAMLGPLLLIVAPCLPAGWALAAPGEPGFFAWALKAVAVLVLIDGLRWLQLQRPRAIQMQGIRRAIIFGLNRDLLALAQRNAALAAPSFVPNVSALLLQRPDSRQPVADLRDTGPRFVERSLRVALGVGYMPQTRESMRRAVLRQLVPVALMLAFVAWMLWSTLGAAQLLPFVRSTGGLLLLEFYAVLLCIIVVFSTLSRVRRMWRQTNTQLPMLALLPQLGEAAIARDELLRTIVSRPARWLAVMLVLVLGLCWYAHLHAQLPVSGVLFGALMPVLWASVLVIGVWQVVGGAGRLERRIFTAVLCPAGILVTFFSMSLPVVASLWLSAHIENQIFFGLALAWIAIALGLCALGRNGHRRFASRPHPFLANAQ